MNRFKTRLNKVIPGGAHTYSRGHDQFSSNSPEIFLRGKGAYTYDQDSNEYLDYGMALRAVNLGYSNEEVNEAAIKQIEYGNNLTRASVVELEAAELIVDLIPSVDMVKFTKNGSTAVSAAVKLSRAYTERELIARCSDHPFFSYDDWFISSTPIKKGIPKDILNQTKLFPYNDIVKLEELFNKFPNQFACLVMEPSTSVHPAKSTEVEGENYLHDVQRLCKKYGVVFVLDEMITGFRWDLGGAQKYYNVTPDLCTFGKAMANGFSVAAIGGKKEIMELGSIETEGKERVFLLSTTHGAEMCGLGAFIKTVEIMKRDNTVQHFWDYGAKLKSELSKIAANKGLADHFKMVGISCSPNYLTMDNELEPSLGFRTLFQQEMIKSNVLIPWIALSAAHGEIELEKTKVALNKALDVYALALEEGVSRHLNGNEIKPVFRQFN